MQEMKGISLFEVSWEVCNKVGGIYAVVSSKALHAVEAFGGDYYALGPDLGNNPGFEETHEACWEPIRQTLSVRNLSCRFGRWAIPGRPKAILVAFKNRYNQNQLLYELWNRYGVDSLTGGWDYVEPVMFSTACGEVINAIFQTVVEPSGGRAIAHFHEWMCGAGLLYLKRAAPEIGTVFTTHATMLGRAMASAGVDIYREMTRINPQREAANYNITAKCSMERVSAREADCFTTVSKITAEESQALLGRNPDTLTFNGLDLRVIPDYSVERDLAKANRTKLLAAVSRLLRRDVPEDTRLVLISGRYEFHNKGMDVFLDAMAGVNGALHGAQTRVVALCLAMGGHSGVNQDAVSGDPDKHPVRGAGWITSHHVYNSLNDPILSTCLRIGLDNRPDNAVQVVFVPALLDGHDGFLNMTYDEVLSACDLGVFPSWYEPWGYTPQESAAWAVPTVTTDLAGFGLWVREQQALSDTDCGIAILSRRQNTYETVVTALRDEILKAVSLSEERLAQQRRQVRQFVDGCSWERFFPKYLEAYQLTLDKMKARSGALSLLPSGESLAPRVFMGTSSVTPVLHRVTAVAPLSVSLSRLRDLAENLWWSWHPDAVELFEDMDSELWERCGHNPVRLLTEISSERLSMLARNKGYLERLRQLTEQFDEYMGMPPRSDLGDGVSVDRPIVYFSTEYGIHESVPIYSGGLGVLSGDHLKSASDRRIPLIAVGLLYKNGYFRQEINKDGRQIAVYPENDFTMLPVERQTDADGNPLMIDLDLPGRRLYAQVWLMRVGRVKLYLLDSDVPQNTPEDRQITARLYEADRDCRIRQEILLGIGGVRLVAALKLTPAVYHMNEGHSAFLVIERIRELMQQNGLSFAEAGEVVRESCVFTTHTPVDAGNERFPLDLVEKYFTNCSKALGLSWQEFLRMGRLEGNDRNLFEMTVLALNYACRANGVSRLHGEVSRCMWHGGWKGIPTAEVPIGHITNGVHVPSYAGPVMRELIQETLGPDWLQLEAGDPAWNRLREIPDSRLWDARRRQKGLLLETIRRRLPGMCAKLGVSRSMQKEMAARLNVDALVIGFARRFAPYKRANLLFADPDRLARLLSDSSRPVILVFAGKAHPADTAGIDIMQEVVRYTTDARFAGKVFFLEDYNLAISRLMVRGCDVWLNTPRRPHEASGTSGMKLSVSGGINLSIADGWWCEGYDGSNGWTIGPAETRLSAQSQSDYADAEALYATLEELVLPLYYECGDDGIPHRWLAVAKNAMVTLTAQYSSDRMVMEYVKEAYLPAAQRSLLMCRDNFALARRLAAWKHDLASRFLTVQITEVLVEGMEGDVLLCGHPLQATVTLKPGTMPPEDLLVQLVAGQSQGADFVDPPSVVNLKQVRHMDDGRLVYAGSLTVVQSGQYAYGVRVMASTEGLRSPLETRLVLWA